MIKALKQKKHKRLYKQRGYTVEPMQGLIKYIFDLDTCWMHCNQNNRWLFIAMGVVVQMHQYRAWQAGCSTWAIKREVLGGKRAHRRYGPPPQVDRRRLRAPYPVEPCFARGFLLRDPDLTLCLCGCTTIEYWLEISRVLIYQSFAERSLRLSRQAARC